MNLIPILLKSAAVLLTLLSFLNASVDLDRSELVFRDQSWRSAPLPDAQLMRTGLLNHSTLAADLAWSWTVIENTEAKRAGRTSDAMPANAAKLVELDPKFYRAFEWFPGAYLLYRSPVTDADLGLVNNYIDIGIRAYPNDWYLPFSAALNYIGYSSRHTPEERLAQNTRALAYLRDSASKPGARDDIGGMILYFENRQRRLEGKAPSREEEAATYLKLLQQTTNPALRESLVNSLKQLGLTEDAYISAFYADQQKLLLASLQTEPYLPLDLWLSLQTPSVQ